MLPVHISWTSWEKKFLLLRLVFTSETNEKLLHDALCKFKANIVSLEQFRWKFFNCEFNALVDEVK